MSGRLIVLDVDSTLITSEVIERIAARAGTEAEVAAVTESAMRGEIDFAESLRQRVATLEGVPDSVFAEVIDEVELTPGAEELIGTLQGEGWTAALVSGGFAEIVESLAGRVGITRFRANRLEVADGRLTGRTVGPVIDRAAKAEALREFCAELGISPADAVAVGDGANDLDMMAAAGLGIAFNAKPLVQEQADIAVNSRSLADVLDVIER
ncbi:phosphoserine phosphatase SerB [Demequina sp. NBRC 110056]|uniref:phosphoserine phosphatase SerB n=1 Tax=Demequina sp. NBRC 110056 TaxID=1570345 RepID=UPI0009FBEEE5|nr:phosphoserine phosphatase SerB [Demequina sp. NBRC 110056]